MLMPSGAHLRQLARQRGIERALAQRARDRNHVQLVGHFQILEFVRPHVAGRCDYHAVPRAGEPLRRKGALRGKRTQLKRSCRPCYCRAIRGRKSQMAGNTQRIGWIGMGRMGYPMAERLLKTGHDVSIWNRTRAKAEPLAQVRRQDRRQALRARGLRRGVLHRVDRQGPRGGLFRQARRGARPQRQAAEPCSSTAPPSRSTSPPRSARG